VLGSRVHGSGVVATETLETGARSVPAVDEHGGSPVCVACAAILGEKRAVEIASGGFVACEGCGSWTLLPRPSPERQAALHNDAAYFEHPYFQDRRGARRRLLDRCRRIFHRLSPAASPEAWRGKRFLDIGCDTGSLLETAAERWGVVPFGVEVSERAAAGARARGLAVHCGTIEEAPAKLRDLDGACAIDVVEHVADPARFLGAVRERLRPGAGLYIQTPNIASSIYWLGQSLFAWTGGRPRATLERTFPAEHVHYLTPRGLGALGRRCGFEVESLGTRTMPASEIATSPPVLLAIMALQCLDAWRRERVLLHAVLRRPA
jgi:2-polyprenyl-3-methyl-5-hydroxy-6-metoxy-1,4-benzoquinol methylase